MRFAALALLLVSGASASDNCSPFHVHIASGADSSTSMTVSFSTTSLSCASTVAWGSSSSSVKTVATNGDGCSTYSTTSKTYGSYTSDCIHHVTISGLLPSTKYYYTPSAGTDIFSFTTAPAAGTGFPINFAVLGDLGQTSNSLSTIQHIQSGESLVLRVSFSAVYSNTAAVAMLTHTCPSLPPTPYNITPRHDAPRPVCFCHPSRW